MCYAVLMSVKVQLFMLGWSFKACHYIFLGGERYVKMEASGQIF